MSSDTVHCFVVEYDDYRESLYTGRYPATAERRKAPRVAIAWWDTTTPDAVAPATTGQAADAEEAIVDE